MKIHIKIRIHEMIDFHCVTESTQWDLVPHLDDSLEIVALHVVRVPQKNCEQYNKISCNS